VPPPFTSVEAHTREDGVVVRVWGREYTFEGGPLPTSIRSQGRALLAGPPRFRTGDEEVRWELPQVVLEGPEAVRLRSRGRLDAPGAPEIRADTLVEYDGMIRVMLALEAVRQPATLPAFAYELELPRDAARFVNRHLEYDYKNRNVAKDTLLEAAGHLPDGTRRLPFVPSLFLGGRRIGLEWWSETNATFKGPHAREPIVIDAGPETVTLRVEPLSAPHRLEAGETWFHELAIFPAPMRPPPEDWRSVRLVSQGLGMPRFATDIGTRFVWISMSPQFPPRWHGLPHSRDDPKQRQLRRRLAQRGIDFIPYGKLTVAPNLHPRVMESFEEWSAGGQWWRKANAPERVVFEANDEDWKPGAPYTYPVCMGRSDYVDWMLDQNVAALEQDDLDGLYFDHGAITRMCRRSPVLEGHKDREVWEYCEVRRCYKRLYERAKRVDPEALVVIHTHGTPRALGAFVDFHLIGESLNRTFSRGSHRAARNDPSVYEPDYLALRDWLDAQFFPPIGGVTALLPQIKWAVDPKQPERGRRFQRALHAWALAQDVPVMFAVSDFETAEAVLRAVDRFGGMSEVRVLPWWEDDSPVSVSPPARATVYLEPGRALVVVANWEDRAIQTEIRLDAAALELGGAPKARDLERQAPLPVADGRIRLRIPPRDFRLVALD